MQGKRLTYKKNKIFQTYEGKKKKHKILYIQKFGKENYDFNSENILLYCQQKDRALNASKNKVRNNAIGS
jgi:hypothetical protein